MRASSVAFTFLLCLAAAYAATSCSLSAYRLRVEYASEPVGLDVVQPRFSWSLAGLKRDARQIAYQLVVMRAGNSTAVVDTGRVASAATTGAAPLRLNKQIDGDTDFEWLLTVWDESAVACSSVKSRFSTGMFDWSDAMWLEPAAADGPAGGLLRKVFQLPQTWSNTSISGRAFVACPGFCRVWVNGARASDSVLGHQLVYENRVLYSTANISALLQPGAHCVEVELGPGW